MLKYTHFICFFLVVSNVFGQQIEVINPSYKVNVNDYQTVSFLKFLPLQELMKEPNLKNLINHVYDIEDELFTKVLDLLNSPIEDPFVRNALVDSYRRSIAISQKKCLQTTDEVLFNKLIAVYEADKRILNLSEYILDWKLEFYSKTQNIERYTITADSAMAVLVTMDSVFISDITLSQIKYMKDRSPIPFELNETMLFKSIYRTMKNSFGTKLMVCAGFYYDWIDEPAKLQGAIRWLDKSYWALQLPDPIFEKSLLLCKLGDKKNAELTFQLAKKSSDDATTNKYQQKMNDCKLKFNLR